MVADPLICQQLVCMSLGHVVPVRHRRHPNLVWQDQRQHPEEPPPSWFPVPCWWQACGSAAVNWWCRKTKKILPVNVFGNVWSMVSASAPAARGPCPSFAAPVSVVASCRQRWGTQRKQLVSTFREQDWHLFGHCKECDLLRIDDIREKKKGPNMKELALFPPGSGMCPKANLRHPTVAGKLEFF